MKAYIVEDHEPMRFILKRLLRKNFAEISDIGESEKAEQALQEIPAFNPNLALIDISLPGMDGIEMIRILKPQFAEVSFLVVTGHEVALYKQAALDAGADAIVSKHDNDQILCAIRTILNKNGCNGQYK